MSMMKKTRKAVLAAMMLTGVAGAGTPVEAKESGAQTGDAYVVLETFLNKQMEIWRRSGHSGSSPSASPGR